MGKPGKTSQPTPSVTTGTDFAKLGDEYLQDSKMLNGGFKSVPKWPTYQNAFLALENSAASVPLPAPQQSTGGQPLGPQGFLPSLGGRAQTATNSGFVRLPGNNICLPTEGIAFLTFSGGKNALVS
jgi:hypothetical protein